MIYFHEGLPRSGKSYEAVLQRIVPALKKGRRVLAYIEGLDHAKLAELAGIELEACRELLQPITREQLADDGVIALAENNCLMVLDEAQNLWGNRAKMSAVMTQFVAEHGHKGIDIVLMGQDYRDVHALWRRRIEVRLAYLKLTAVGAQKSYSVTTFRHLGGDEWTRVGRKIHKYDPRVFGAYASHVSEDVDPEVYQDGRATVWSLPLLKFWIPLAAVGGLVGILYLVSFFRGEKVKAPSTAVPGGALVVAPTPAPAKPASEPLRLQTVTTKVEVKRERSAVEAWISDLSGKHRIRLAGVMTMGGKSTGVVEWMDGASHVVDRLSLDDLRAMGVAVALGSDGFARLAVGEWSAVVTTWPVFSNIAASRATLERLKPHPSAETSAALGAIEYTAQKKPL